MYRLVLFLIPFTISYAIVSDLGKPQHNYRAPDSIGVPHSTLQKPYAN